MDTVCTGRRRLFVPKDFVVESEVADNGCGKYGGVAGATSARKLVAEICGCCRLSSPVEVDAAKAMEVASAMKRCSLQRLRQKRCGGRETVMQQQRRRFCAGVG